MNLITRSMLTFGLILMLGGCASHQKNETAGQYFDDSVITTKVKSAILGDPALKVMQIAVETYQGKVQLSGFVDSPQSVKRAGEVASSVEGVREVKNNLIVK
ncbi:phospholipid-binding BON domain protein [Geotalea daltonii FRC-32]|uniref:Phospholipid-binding BON domain protein n=1 Tax=Geotalea daltonii (strain DSM 22248 / JCM 15807 / FRC-32) TaxID=316067 RepID=B9M132_GEODF|nr:BON domain-containing protein [Geotalea daltonii]ACM19102.1 phospholipid-binding BON domain protein [Geotalea daltonii FRC-32]